MSHKDHRVSGVHVIFKHNQHDNGDILQNSFQTFRNLKIPHLKMTNIPNVTKIPNMTKNPNLTKIPKMTKISQNVTKIPDLTTKNTTYLKVSIVKERKGREPPIRKGLKLVNQSEL